MVSTTADVGADEVYSCDNDLSEDDLYCPFDFSADGAVNYGDMAVFGRAWQTDSSDIDWNVKCDLDSDGDVDIGDLQVFLDDDTNRDSYWLSWTACWRDSRESIFGGNGGMAAAQSMMIPIESVTEETETLTVAEQLEIDGEAAYRIAVVQMILDTIAIESAASNKNNKDFKEAEKEIEDILAELIEAYTQ